MNSSHSIKSLHLKQISFIEGHSPTKLTISPKLNSHRKFQPTKALFSPTMDQATPKIFNFVTNSYAPKVDLLKKASKTSKPSLDYPPLQVKLLRMESTSNEISPNISPTMSPIMRGHSSQRALKNQLHITRAGTDLKAGYATYGDLQRNLKEFASKSSFEPVDLLMTLNKKTEEINALKKSVNQLQGKVSGMMTVKKETSDDLQKYREFREELDKKNQIIEVYGKLLDLCSSSNERGGTSSLKQLNGRGEIEDSPQKPKHSNTLSVKTDSDTRKNFMLEPQYINSSFNNTMIHKSTNPTLSKLSIHSPSVERYDSQMNSKLTEHVEVDERSISKEEIRSLSPKNSLFSTKNSSQTSQKTQGRGDKKLRAIESIYKSVIKSSNHKIVVQSKSDVSKNVVPSANEIVIFDNLEKTNITNPREGSTHFNETEADNNSHTQEHTIKVLNKSESGLNATNNNNNLSNVFERLDTVFKKYEDGRASLMRKNIEIMKKIEQIVCSRAKTQEA